MQRTCDRDPVPTATYADQLGATQATCQGATATTAAADVTNAAAGGKGPSDSIPDRSTNSRKTDRRSDSAFYRNATYTCGANDAAQPFVLKEVPLTPFDGDVREYPRFRDRFLDIIEARPNLEPRYKLVHLLQYLRGEPLRMANRLRLTDDNYFIVVDRLEKRYGNEVSFHNVLVRDLAQLKPLTSTMLSDVTRFYDDVFPLITDLQPFIKTDSPIEHALLVGKIPVKLRLHLIEETSYTGDRTINGLLNALDQLVCQGRLNILSGLKLTGEPETDIDLVPRPILCDEDASSQHSTCEDSTEASIQGSQQTSSGSAEDRASVAVNASTERRLKERRTCPLCGGLHTAFRCDVYTNVNARMRRIMKLKLCLLCLREGHQAATCPRRTTNSCKICRAGPHNRAVCMAANKRTQAKDRRRSPARNPGSSVDSENPDPKRHTQEKSVNWGDGKSTSTATNLRSSEAQSSSNSTPKITRKKKSKKTGAAPSGRDGTPRPPTTSNAEGMKQKTTDACGDSRLLPARRGLKPTDRCSNNDESTQFDHQADADGTDNSDAAADRHELREEEDTSSESSGECSDSPPPTHCSDAEIDDWEDGSFQPRDSTLLPTDAIYCASSTTEPTTLLECIRATAENPTTDVSREVLIFFDSGSNRSFVTTELARDLSLPRDRPCSLRVSTFGNELPTTIEGFFTSIVLRSKHRRLQPLAIIAGDCIVPSVRTALIDPADLNKLRRSELSPSPIQATPDILIGQDLVSHFKRRYGPPLPHGFYVVNTILGPLLGGSGKVPTTVPEVTRSSNIATSPCAVHRSPSLTELCDTIGSPSEDETSRSATSGCDKSASNPIDSSGDEATAASRPLTSHGAHSVPRPPNTSNGAHSVLRSKHRIKGERTRPLRPTVDPGNSPNDAAHQNFSLPVEKNTFLGSKTSTSCCTDRHSPSDGTQGSRPSRKQPNPLDTSAPLPPPTTHVTLQQELRTDPSAHTLCDYVTACPSHSSSQQNPALNNPRKTRLRRRSATFGRTVLGTKNQRELRKCDTMRFLPDQPRPATDTSTHAVPGSTDPDAHYDHRTFPGAQLPEMVYVAAAQPPLDRRQAAETPNSSSTARQGADSAAVPSPAHSVGREQAQEPRSTQKCQRTHATYGAIADLPVAQGQPSLTSIGSGQRELAHRRVSTHVQEGQPSRSARRATSATAIHGPSIPIIDGFVSKSYATLLAISQDDAYQSPAVIEDLPPQYEVVGSINHLGVPTSYLPTQLHMTIPTDNSPLACVTFDQLLQENSILPWKFILGSTLGALPPYWEMATADACLHLHEEAQGTTYHGLPICGIGPTGFFLNAESNDTLREYEGQRQTLLRFGRIARNAGKCLVLVIYNEPKTSIDLHCEATRLLCQDVQLPADHPIHLVAYRASAAQLLHWLATFSNVVLGVDHMQLSNLLMALRSTTGRTESYLHALQLQELFKSLPLDHIALHSGCPSTYPSEDPDHFQTPTVLLRTAELFEQLTGTPKDVLLARSARNLNTIYQLSINLPDCTMTTCEGRNESSGQHFTDDFSARPHLGPGSARRADQADQATTASHRCLPLNTTHSVVPAVHGSPVARQTCVFCNDAHPPTECTTFQEVNKRMRRLQTLKRCFICLAIGHPSSKCPERTTSVCRYCKRNQHHSSLCRSPEVRHATGTPALLPAAADQRPAAAPEAARSAAKATGPTLRTPDAAHSVAKGAGPIPQIPDAAHSVAPGTFPPAMNHFRVDQTLSTKKADTRAAPRSAKRRSAAVPSTPAQAPSKQPSRLTSKRTTAKSSGKRRQVHATTVADPGRADHPAAPSTRNCTSRGEKTEHPSRDEKAHDRFMSPHQNPLTETPNRPTQHADVRCELCAQRHRAERCTSFSSIEERRQRAQYLWLCFTCLANGHRTEDCPNVVTFSCAFCNHDIHHRALCTAARGHATAAAEASSTPVVVPAEAHQQLLAPRTAVPDEDLQQEPTMAEDRRAPKRQNRKPKK